MAIQLPENQMGFDMFMATEAEEQEMYLKTYIVIQIELKPFFHLTDYTCAAKNKRIKQLFFENDQDIHTFEMAVSKNGIIKNGQMLQWVENDKERLFIKIHMQEHFEMSRRFREQILFSCGFRSGTIFVQKHYNQFKWVAASKILYKSTETFNKFCSRDELIMMYIKALPKQGKPYKHICEKVFAKFPQMEFKHHKGIADAVLRQMELEKRQAKLHVDKTIPPITDDQPDDCKVYLT